MKRISARWMDGWMLLWMLQLRKPNGMVWDELGWDGIALE